MEEIEFVGVAAAAAGNLSVAAESLLLSTSVCNVPRFLVRALSGALTGVFAVVGAFTGAVTGALAGRATESGLLRGAGLGAVAGAVLSVKVLEASRAYWCSEHSSFSNPSFSVTEFIEGMFNGRFVQEQVGPTILHGHQWQVNISEVSYEELYDMFGPGVHEGASKACIETLPSHAVTEQNQMDSSGDTICCTICLQDLLQGEIARAVQGLDNRGHMASFEHNAESRSIIAGGEFYTPDNEDIFAKIAVSCWALQQFSLAKQS